MSDYVAYPLIDSDSNREVDWNYGPYRVRTMVVDYTDTHVVVRAEVDMHRGGLGDSANAYVPRKDFDGLPSSFREFLLEHVPGLLGGLVAAAYDADDLDEDDDDE